MSRTLLDWKVWLERQYAFMQRESIGYLVPLTSEDLGDWLVAESTSVAAKVEESVRGYVERGDQWLTLSESGYFYFCQRFALAAFVVEVELETQPDGRIYDSNGEIPHDLDNVQAFLSWALVDVWTASGEAVLRRVAADIFRLVGDLPLEGLTISAITYGNRTGFERLDPPK